MVIMKRFIFLSVLFLFIGTISHAQMIKPNRVQVEKKSTTPVAVHQKESIKTNKTKLPKKKAVKTRISMQAITYKRSNK